eukprot:scaffold991_cov128-Cylindrotheca_fusiformis.AAC.20
MSSEQKEGKEEGSKEKNETSSEEKKEKKNGAQRNLSEIDVWECEKSTRTKLANRCGRRKPVGVLVDWYSSILVFAFFLISLESLISIALSVGLTVCECSCLNGAVISMATVFLTIHAFSNFVACRHLSSFHPDPSLSNPFQENKDTIDGSVMNWVLLSFAVITPMSSSISMAFSRREMALGHFSVIRATLLNIYSAHACWDWAKDGKPGRDPNHDWLKQCDTVLQASLQLCSELTRMLTLPSFNRARHRVTKYGRDEAKEVEKLVAQLHVIILQRMAAITDQCEVFKYQGLPPNEATRIRQWERMVTERIGELGRSRAMEMLLAIKRYRTPQALRSFARLFSVFLPPLYAPYYGQMAKDLDSLGLAIVFSAITSIALTSLFESINQIEDPFTGIVALDSINMSKELKGDFRQQLLAYRLHHFPDAANPYQMEDSIIQIEGALDEQYDT